MLDEEEARLVAEVRECRRVSVAAMVAVRQPGYSLLNGSDLHLKLLEIDKAARLLHQKAADALRLCREAQKPRVSGAGG